MGIRNGGLQPSVSTQHDDQLEKRRSLNVLAHLPDVHRSISIF